MLIIKVDPEENGAHANQNISGILSSIPEGWVKVPEELEAQTAALLPWITAEIKNGEVIAVSENAGAKEAWDTALETDGEGTENVISE